ncbi:MAG TPA: 16S rRNA pseudouridine(516) synthase, partial [Gemmatimonadaceae bacterium]
LADDEPFVHDDVRVDDERLDPPPGSVLMFHKPVGYVCATKDADRLIYELLPPRFRRRSPVMAPVGRLDRDTSGLLLLTDDGQMNHRVTSPRRHLPKTYEARLAAELRGDERQLFGAGTLMLAGESSPLAPATLEVVDARHVRVTITEGRYHQIRRMFAAVGNHVETLHRVSVGGLRLGELPPGEWRVLSAGEVSALWSPPAP